MEGKKKNQDETENALQLLTICLTSAAAWDSQICREPLRDVRIFFSAFHFIMTKEQAEQILPVYI